MIITTAPLFSHSVRPDAPAVLILDFAGLDAGDGIVELLGNGANGAIADGHDLVHIAQLADGGDDGGGAGAEDLF